VREIKQKQRKWFLDGVPEVVATYSYTLAAVQPPVSTDWRHDANVQAFGEIVDRRGMPASELWYGCSDMQRSSPILLVDGKPAMRLARHRLVAVPLTRQLRQSWCRNPITRLCVIAHFV